MLCTIAPKKIEISARMDGQDLENPVRRGQHLDCVAFHRMHGSQQEKRRMMQSELTGGTSTNSIGRATRTGDDDLGECEIKAG
jgi:hypothetical protein